MELTDISKSDCQTLSAKLKEVQDFMMVAKMTEATTKAYNDWITSAKLKIEECGANKTLTELFTTTASGSPIPQSNTAIKNTKSTDKSGIRNDLKPFLIIAGIVVAGLTFYKLS